MGVATTSTQTIYRRYTHTSSGVGIGGSATGHVFKLDPHLFTSLAGQFGQLCATRSLFKGQTDDLATECYSGTIQYCFLRDIAHRLFDSLYTLLIANTYIYIAIGIVWDNVCAFTTLDNTDVERCTRNSAID